MKTQRALTLLETLVTYFIVAIIFSAALLLINKSAAVIRFSQQHSKALVATQAALDRIVCEAREAVSIQSPVPTLTGQASTVSNFSFTKINPATQSQRLPVPIPTSPPSAWAASDPSQELQIAYHLDNATQILLRDVTPPSGPTLSLPLAEDVNDFSCSRQPYGSLLFQVTLRLSNSQTTLSAQVVCPVAP